MVAAARRLMRGVRSAHPGRLLRSGLALVALLAVASILVALRPDTARGALPGQNGRIYFSRQDAPPSPQRNVYAVSPDGTGLVNLTNDTATNAHPAPSPDGTRIAYSRCVGGTCEIWVMNADGSGKTRLADHFAVSPTWSPDGARIAFTGRTPASGGAAA